MLIKPLKSLKNVRLVQPYLVKSTGHRNYRSISKALWKRVCNSYSTGKTDYVTLYSLLFAHENLAFRIRDFLWRARREILAVVILQQGFPTQLSAKKRVYWMLNFHVRRVSIEYL